jgi:cytochrome P450/NADPH-cytochrome P450 reductase
LVLSQPGSGVEEQKAPRSPFLRLLLWLANSARWVCSRSLEQRHGRGSHLPVGTPVDVARLLGEFVELQDVATRSVTDTAEGEQAYRAEVLDRHVSLLDLLEAQPSVRLPLELYLDRCSPIRARYYSISSSPLTDPRRPSLTVGVLESQAWSGTGQYKGLTSNFVRRLQPGATVFGYVRTPTPAFLPLTDPAKPMVLIGTGVAPFRGFLQDRATRRERGEKVGRALMLLGCRHPEHDWYYRDQMQDWAGSGLVELHPAFSSLTGEPHRFVRHALAAAGDTVWKLLESGGHIYLCGHGVRMAPAVRAALLELYLEQTSRTEAQAEAWLDHLRESGRYAEDVFAPSE